MIVYTKLFDLMRKQGKTVSQIKREKIIGQETFYKLQKGTGIYEEYDYRNPKTGQKETRVRINSVDTSTIESLCQWLNCDITDILQYIPNTEENADKLCSILKCTREELPTKVPMKNNKEIPVC